MPATTYFDNFLKNNYVTGVITKLVNEEHVFLDKLSKSTGAGYQLIDILIDKNAQGAGATLAAAQAGSQQAANSNVGGAQWIVPWGDYSACVEIPDKTMAQSASDLGAFFEAKKEEIDSLYRTFGDIMSAYVLRDSGHSLATGTISSGVITLTNKSDAVNFERGQLLVASANDGTSSGHTLLGSGSIGYVIAVNANAGTVTVSATSDGTAGTPGSWTGTMYLFRSGDFGGSGATQILDGFGSYVPATDPSDTFRNVARAVDVVARSGVRLTAAECAGLDIETRIKRLLARMASNAKSRAPKDIFLHPMVWQSLANALEARGARPLDGKAGTMNFSKLQLASPGRGGMVDIWADKFMPIDACYAVDFEYIKLRHLDGFPKIVNGDGLTMLRKATSNNYEFRLTTYPAFYVKGPGFCGRCPMPAVY